MQRRQVLAGAAMALLGGCVSYPRGAPSNGGESSTPDTTKVPTVDGTQFDVQSAGCGTIKEQATVSASEETLTVSVDGTTSAPSACYSARLADATYDASSGELRVVVEAFDASDGGVCAQCITTIDYAASVAFAGGLPERVVVVHRSRGEEREVTSRSL